MTEPDIDILQARHYFGRAPQGHGSICATKGKPIAIILRNWRSADEAKLIEDILRWSAPTDDDASHFMRFAITIRGQGQKIGLLKGHETSLDAFTRFFETLPDCLTLR